VILHALHLNNVGVYGGNQSLILSPPSSDRPIILIGALNGGGKTTLLGALQLALYGSRANGIDRTRKGYERYLQDLIHRSADPAEGASVELDFERRIEGLPVHYHIRRAWRIDGGKVIETFSALRNGEPDSFLSNHWEESVDTFLPPRLAHLFFFDGEQIERMADEENTTLLLQSAVQSLLGLDLVSRLDEDLAALDRRKKLALRSVEDRGRLEFLEQEAQSAESTVEATFNRLAGLNTVIDQKERYVETLRESFRASGGENFLERDAWNAEHFALSSKLKSVESSFREIISDAAPFLLIPDSINDLFRKASSEAADRKDRIVWDAEQRRDLSVLRDLKGKLPANSIKLVALSLERFRPKVAEKRPTETLHIDDEFLDALKHLTIHLLPKAREAIVQLAEEAESLEDQIAELDRRLAVVPDADAIGAIQRDLEKSEIDLQELAKLKANEEEVARQAKFELRIRQSAVTKELERRAQEWEGTDHDRRIVERIPKIKRTLEAFRQKVISQHIGALEVAILEGFHYLIRKPKLMGAIRIDSSNFRINLEDPSGREIPFGLLSAGERQLLATSILWALARTSGRPFPIIIDTPLGRLDSNHRSHVVQRYFPAASHQVILLSTDEEIVGRYHEMLAPHIGRSAVLSFDEKEQRTVINEGYFSPNEATA